jgi:hypothetical protein
MIKSSKVGRCGVCSCATLDLLWELPNFPLTEMFGKYDQGFPSFNQKLLFCDACSHVQLETQIDPNFLYTPSQYAFRTLTTPKITRELDFLISFIRESFPDLTNSSILEVGSSNLELATTLKPFVGAYSVCDPLLKDQDGQVIGGVNIFGCLAEELVEKVDLSFNLIFGRHVLEHIENPLEFLGKMVESASPETVFIFEVPSLQHIRMKNRFDAVIHQHCQYFDVTSVLKLLNQIDCHLSDYKFNSEGSNGGSLLFSFSRNSKRDQTDFNNQGDLSMKKTQISKELSRYKLQMSLLADLVDSSQSKVVGYGAAHMLATFNYHLGGGVIESLDFIFDDNADLHGSEYRNIRVPIVSTESLDLSRDIQTVLITSMENCRSMTTKMLALPGITVITPSLL